MIRLRILWYPPPSHCSSSTIPRESGSLENPPLPSLGSLYPELTNEFLTLGLLLRGLLKIISLNRDLSGTLFRTDALAKKVQHKIICLQKNLLLKNCIWMIYHVIRLIAIGLIPLFGILVTNLGSKNFYRLSLVKAEWIKSTKNAWS